MNKEELLNELLHQANSLMIKKYKKGAREHKENLLQKTDLLDEAIAENIDCLFYLLAEKMRRNDKKK